MKVRIIKGNYGYHNPETGSVRAIRMGGIVDVDDEEAARLFELGVASFVIEETTLDTVPEDEDTESPPAPVATASEGGDGGEVGENPPDEEPRAEAAQEGEGTLDIVDGHFTMESLMEMKRSDMEALAGDLGLDVSKCRNKTEIAKLIAAVEIPEQDFGEDPPALSAEDVVAP